MKKSVLALMLSLLFVLCSCGGTNDRGNTDGDRTDHTAEMIKVIEDGRSDYKIIVPSSPSETETFAAEELKYFLKEITGFSLPIINDRNRSYEKDDKFISIGKTRLLTGSGVDTYNTYRKLNLTGFYVFAEGNKIIVDASEDVGVLYGVYDLIEKFGGVRFVTEDFTYIPKSDAFSIEEGFRIDAPAFSMRSYLSGIFYTDKLFMARKRLGCEFGDPDVKKYGGSNLNWTLDENYTHCTLDLAHPEIYLKDNPQMFNVSGGVARDVCMTYGITEDGHIDPDIPVSAATVIRDSVKELIKEYPEKIYFFVGQEDGNYYCTCPTCEARTEKYGGFRSSLVVMFLNALAEEIIPWAETEFPGREVKLATFAYQYSEEAPAVYDEAEGKYKAVSPLVIPNENVYIRIAPIRANFIYSMNDPRQNAVYHRVFSGWQALTDNFWIWDYSTNYSDFNFIFPNIASLKENYLFYRDIGVTFCMTQADHKNKGDFQDRLKGYVASKLMWDPDLSADKLTTEFFDLYFGKYSDKLRGFWETWSRFLSESAADENRKFYLAENTFFNALAPENYPIELLERSIGIINGAIEENLSDNTVSAYERDVMNQRLTGALVIPERMIMRNYTDYYGATGSLEFAAKWFSHMDVIGQTFVSEASSVENEKIIYGL